MIEIVVDVVSLPELTACHFQDMQTVIFEVTTGGWCYFQDSPFEKMPLSAVTAGYLSAILEVTDAPSGFQGMYLAKMAGSLRKMSRDYSYSRSFE